MGSFEFVQPFDGAEPDPARLGGKGASLVRLVQLRHRVPAGFTVTADAFRTAIAHLDLAAGVRRVEEAMQSGGDAIGAGKQVQDQILRRRIPEHVLGPVLDLATRLGLYEATGGVIVRSSATVEDSAAFSFAGIFESLRTRTIDELEPTIRQVWAAAFAPRALSYAIESGMREVPTMAVVVQRFLEATRSGVMFTRFDGPDGRRILVEHVEGGCQKLVNGEVIPDRLWLTPEAPVDDSSGRLGPAHVRELVRLAGDLEEMFGGPQDVEWVIHGEAVHLVQSRPITVGLAAQGSLVQGAPPPILRGVPASGGAGVGGVHLVFNIEQALALERGQVLVTPMTNPDMVVAMRNSAAIVTDVGGIICHAAIVSRELGLPCVVGTENATTALSAGQVVTVDGSAGAVYQGALAIAPAGATGRPFEWSDLWAGWLAATAGRSDLVPIVPTIAALEAAPDQIERAVLLADVDLRADRYGLWNDLEGMAPVAQAAAFDDFVARAGRAAGRRRVHIAILGSLSPAELEAAVARARQPSLALWRDGDAELPALALAPDRWPETPAAVPLAAALAIGRPVPPPLPGMEEAVLAACDTGRFFGHRPQVARASMPAAEWRRLWWTILPEYGRYHAEFATEQQSGEADWYNVRPELVISPLLKSLVQPGFEMVPRVFGFTGVGPLHLKWIKCRYHFRADRFAEVWDRIVHATWDEAAMADLMRRVRWSYQLLREVLPLFPRSDAEARALTGEQMVALVTSWWPRWVEFFALNWFIQAQGDDIAFPFIQETVAHNLARLGPPPDGVEWPVAADFILPTTPVMSGEYMASVAGIRQALLARQLDTTEVALAALSRGEHPEVDEMLSHHLDEWGWMRDRDLLFEPWDTPARVIDTALKTEPHAVVPYRENLSRNLVALGFHLQLAHPSGRAGALAHAARFLHDLNVERENHHVLWLKYSYPLRRVVLEVERRLIAAGSLDPGDVFFMVAPELIAAAGALPAPLAADLVARVKNRRLGFHQEAKLAPPGAGEAQREDDYF